MHDVHRASIQERPELADHLQLLACEDPDSCTPPQIHPALVEDGVHGVFEPERVHGFGRERDADRAGRVEFAMSVYGDVDVIANCGSGVLEADACVADLLGCQG